MYGGRSSSATGGNNGGGPYRHHQHQEQLRSYQHPQHTSASGGGNKTNCRGGDGDRRRPPPPSVPPPPASAGGAGAGASAGGCGDDKFERFENWLRENGAKFEMLELREYDCGVMSEASSSSAKNDEEKKELTPAVDDDNDAAMLYDDLSGRNGSGSYRTAGSGKRSSVRRGRAGAGAAAVPPAGSGAGSGDDPLSPPDGEMRGVHARTHIPPNTICMSVPRRCLITVEMGQATPIGQAILHSDLDLDAPKHIFLMIYILWDRKVNGPNSFFHPYYEILPPTLRNMPIFWNREELAHLEGSYLLQQIQDRSQAITEDYYAICQICPQLKQIATLDEFKWARMCVCSRNFGLQMDGHRTSALVPHADMLNHYRPRETKWTFDEERQAFTITSLQNIPAGSQVYDSYGQKCNHRFLLNYGFAVEDNRELDGFCPNEVPLELYVEPDDELFAEKLEYWTRGETENGGGVAAGSCTAAATVGSLLHSTGILPGGPYNHHHQQQQILYQQGGSSPPTSGNSNHSGGSNGASSSRAAPPPPPAPVVKRVRVCASNNENTRLLFSLLRALACNRDELIAIGGMPPPPQQQQQQQAHQADNGNSNRRQYYSSGNGAGSRSSIAGANGRSGATGSGNASSNGGGGGGGGDVASVTRNLLGFSNVKTMVLPQHQARHQQQQQQQQQPTVFGDHVHQQQYPSNTGNNSSSNSSGGAPSFSIRPANNESNFHHGLSSSQAAAAAAAAVAASAAYHRSCRDIRHPISLRNERAAMHLLIKVAQRHLSQYPTTLAQDMADLMDEQSFPRFSNVRHAKIQVRGEKEVLHHFVMWARTALEILDVIEEELWEEQRCGSVEVQLTQTGRTRVVASPADAGSGSNHDDSDGGGGGSSAAGTGGSGPIGYEYVIRRMEDDVDNGVHHTVLRYCADVLGSLRREEFKNIRRQQHQQHHHSYQQHLHQEHPSPSSLPNSVNNNKGVYSSNYRAYGRSSSGGGGGGSSRGGGAGYL